MSIRALRWGAKYIGYAILLLFVRQQVSLLLMRALWWSMRQSGAANLSFSTFSTNAFLPLSAVCGLLTGLVPADLLWQTIRSSLARFSVRPPTGGTSKEDVKHPALWLWAPFTFVFCILFLSWTGGYHTVLHASSINFLPRLNYFFAPPRIDSFADAQIRRLFIVVVVVGPMLFFQGYTVAVLLRRKFQLPQHPPREYDAGITDLGTMEPPPLNSTSSSPATPPAGSI